MRESSTRGHKPPGPGAEQPDVILDVVFEDGLLFLVVANVGNRPALKVSCRFEQPFHGLGGRTEMSRLRLFRKIEFLAPRKEIRTLLDASTAYFSRREPTKLAATITFHDEGSERYEKRITHDLAIYRDIAYVVDRPGLQE